METAKEKVIREKYGEYFEKCNPDKNGWVSYDVWFKNIGHKIDYDYNKNMLFMRPKSLSVIENNNGWIRIESEDDLPKEDIECFYVIEVPERYSNSGSRINTGSFKFNKNIMSGQQKYFTVDNFFYHRFPFVTHYQPIIKPSPPIF